MTDLETADERKMLLELGFTDEQINHLLFERSLADRGVQQADGVGPRLHPRAPLVEMGPEDGTKANPRGE